MNRRENVPGTIYLIHFETPLAHARHYLGWTEGPLVDRIAAHARGEGARIMAVVKERGIDWRIVRTWEGVTRHKERSLKRATHGPKLCPVCKEERRRAA